MIVGEIRNQIDSIWNDFWSGGLSNPLSVMEQITYLLFIKPLDELQTNEERKAAMLKQPLERRIFPKAPIRAGARTRDCDGPRSSFSSRKRCSRSSTSTSSHSFARWWRARGVLGNDGFLDNSWSSSKSPSRPSPNSSELRRSSIIGKCSLSLPAYPTLAHA
jgi:HsdM N-terminal domain